MEKRQKIVVLGLVQNDRGEVLLSQRFEPKLPGAHLKWQLPGGTNDFGESLEETARRELLEETGLTVEIGTLLPKSIHKNWQYPTHVQHTLVFCYICSSPKGELKNDDSKASQIKWVPLDEALQLDLLDGVFDFLQLHKENSTR
ncbi:MAG TPA: NUDIX domain-containing protein [Candidatus Nanoarchaeia archaeon]|nr:NUDIX domain-containing protein [Candidatus Nanoarchaeia archaeon]